MDFGDYIYIILAVVFSIASALGKKRKANKKAVQPSKTRDIFEELFDIKSDVANPIPEPAFSGEVSDDYSSDQEDWMEEEPADVTPAKSDLQQKLDSLYTRSTEEKTPKVVLKVTPPVKRHSILDDLHDRNQVQKAVIYAEIFQRKF